MTEDKTPNAVTRGSVQLSLCVGSATQKLLILYGRVQNQPVLFPFIYLISPVSRKCYPGGLHLFLTDFYLS